MSRNPLILLGVALIVGSAALLVACNRGRTDATADGTAGSTALAAQSASFDERTTINALGRLEPDGGVVDVGATAGERLERLEVRVGQQVKAGAILAYLSSHPLREREAQLADVQVKEAEARRAADDAYGAAVVAEAEVAIELVKLELTDIAALKAQLKLAELSREVAQKDLERLRGVGGTVVSPQELEHQSLKVQQAEAEVANSQAQLVKLEASHAAHEREAAARLATAKASLERLKSASLLESLQQSSAAARQRVELSILRAPRDGTILEIVTHPGETIGQRPVLKLGDTAHMIAVAEVYETDVGRVRVGQQATITSDALGQPLTGVVESIGLMVAKNEAVSLDPTASADVRVVDVRIRLDANTQASRLVNLQVDVRIDTAPVESPGNAT